MIDCGRFNKRIKVLSWQSGTNELGQDTTSLKEYKTVWAEIHPLKGKEYLEAKMIESKTTYRITCRYFSGLTEEMYIDYNSKELAITSICDVDMKHKYYEIVCTETHKKEQKRESS